MTNGPSGVIPVAETSPSFGDVVIDNFRARQPSSIEYLPIGAVSLSSLGDISSLMTYVTNEEGKPQTRQSLKGAVVASHGDVFGIVNAYTMNEREIAPGDVRAYKDRSVYYISRMVQPDRSDPTHRAELVAPLRLDRVLTIGRSAAKGSLYERMGVVEDSFSAQLQQSTEPLGYKQFSITNTSIEDGLVVITSPTVGSETDALHRGNADDRFSHIKDVQGSPYARVEIWNNIFTSDRKMWTIPTSLAQELLQV